MSRRALVPRARRRMASKPRRRVPHGGGAVRTARHSGTAAAFGCKHSSGLWMQGVRGDGGRPRAAHLVRVACGEERGDLRAFELEVRVAQAARKLLARQDTIAVRIVVAKDRVQLGRHRLSPRLAEHRDGHELGALRRGGALLGQYRRAHGLDERHCPEQEVSILDAAVLVLLCTHSRCRARRRAQRAHWIRG